MSLNVKPLADELLSLYLYPYNCHTANVFESRHGTGVNVQPISCPCLVHVLSLVVGFEFIGVSHSPQHLHAAVALGILRDFGQKLHTIVYFQRHRIFTSQTAYLAQRNLQHM